MVCVHTHRPESSRGVPEQPGRDSPTSHRRALRFRLSLPSSGGAIAIIGGVNRSVLVVDDDPEFRKLAGRILAASGLTLVGEADSVAAALAAAVRLEPSAVLVDVELPDGDGVTLARKLAALPWRPRIVLTSVDADITSIAEACCAGARTFVNKADLPGAPLARLFGED
jgi:CheY-like chemotaxis protein